MSPRALSAVLLAVGALATPAAGELARTQNAALSGDFGLAVSYTGARQKNFLQRDFSSDQRRVVVTFAIRPEDGFTFAGGGKNDILLLRSGNRKVVRAFLKRKGNGFQLKFKIRRGGRLRGVKKKVSLRLGETSTLAVDWKVATSAALQDGAFRIRLDDEVEFEVLTNLDNAGETVDNFLFGQVSRPPSGWSGQISFDNLGARRILSAGDS